MSLSVEVLEAWGGQRWDQKHWSEASWRGPQLHRDELGQVRLL